VSTKEESASPFQVDLRDQSDAAEDQAVGAFGYRQEFRRRLRFFALFAVSFSFVSITTGIFLNYGVGIANWGPASIWLWLLVGAFQLVVALVVAELGTRIPLAGFVYQWSARLVNSTYGWFVGFAALAAMTVSAGAIFLLVTSPLLLSEFNINAPSPRLVLLVAFLLLLATTVINIISVQLAARVNTIAVVTEIIGTVVFGVLLFVLWGVHAKPSHYGMGFLGNTTGLVHSPTWYAITLAGLLGIYTLVGFEVAADLSEECVNTRRNVPRAVLMALSSAVLLGMIALIGFTIAIPDLKSVQTSPLPLLTIAQYWLPAWVVKVFIAFVIFSMVAIIVEDEAAQSRLVFSLARDNMLPFSKYLRRVNPKTRTPIVAMIVLGVLNVGFMIYGYFQANSFNTLIGMTAIVPYIIYFMITLAYALKRRVLEEVPGAFSLGRAAPVVIGVVLVWTVIVMLALSAPSRFYGSDKLLGGAAVLAGLWYLVALRRRLREGRAGVTTLAHLEEVADGAGAAPGTGPSAPQEVRPE